MEIYDVIRGEYLISTNKALLDFGVIHGFLSRSYWSPGISPDIVKRAAENSVTFGVYHGNTQVGYARVISDRTTFAYLADVFIVEEERGRGLSKWLVQTILQTPFLQGLRRWMLATKDAHGLYVQQGFIPLEDPTIFMQISKPDIYLETERK
ncbi:GNAT family N-acetyltransferase [Dyadobacter sp. 32]|uniref:GNAT family N-acetyltransferase n=1 Tax=Dyadobacter sp. 32 TaxID=538966 RepID=UPI0011EF7E04